MDTNSSKASPAASGVRRGCAAAEPGTAAAAAGPRPPLFVAERSGPERVADRARRVDRAIDAARDALVALQHEKGYWHFELEADCTIPAEYVLLMHFLDEIDVELQRKLAVYLRARQGEDGGWPLFYGGAMDLSCTIKAYWALKLSGDEPEAPHMARARQAILAQGGAARANVFTRFAMAMFGQVPWRATPFLPIEIVLLPKWFPFHLSKVSYWSRAVMVPLAILCSLKARAVNPTGIGIAELFTTPPWEERRYFAQRSGLHRLFLGVERTARLFEPLIPRFVRRLALRKAERWFIERLNGEDGLGAIFPAMVNAYESLRLLGHPADSELCVTARKALRKLLVVREHDAYCQPCLSPVWDTALASLALQEVVREWPHEPTTAAYERAHAWLESVQITDGPADWRDYRPNLAPGGWAFEFSNPHYPDLDDTSAVGWAMVQCDAVRHERSMRLAADWIAGMQSRNGGFASFDADNTHDYLNHIPFADHGALLDPPTADVTARSLTFLHLFGDPAHADVRQRALECLWREQEPSGAWYGRWGTNYIYGTWAALAALDMMDWPKDDARIVRAADWLCSKQREDGSWGEDCDTYFFPDKAGEGRAGTSFQTAWAVLGLLAAGRGESEQVRRGVDWLLDRQEPDGLWQDPWFTAPGFPRVFYLLYHGYSRFFPLWALARYRNHARRVALSAGTATGTAAGEGAGRANAPK